MTDLPARPYDRFITAIATPTLVQLIGGGRGLTAGLDHLIKCAQLTDWNGIEAWPFNFGPFTRINGTLEQCIVAQHQLSRTEHWYSVGRFLSNPGRIPQAIAMPHRDSAETFRRLLKRSHLPTTLYEQAYLHPDFRQLSCRQVQVTCEAASLWGVNTISEFLDSARSKGYHWLVLDSHKIFSCERYSGQPSRFGADFAKLQGQLEEIDLGAITELHIGIMRLDALRDEGDKVWMTADAKWLCELPMSDDEQAALRLPYLLDYLHEKGWRGLVTCEAYIPGLKKLAASTATPFDLTQLLMRAHGQLAYTMASAV